MRIDSPYLPGSVLPTVVVVSVVMLTAMLGLLLLWQHEALLFARNNRLRQARADVESAYTLYSLNPSATALTAAEGYRLYDSLPSSRVGIDVRPWGLYDAVRITTADSLMRVCRLLGAEPDAGQTLYYADDRSAVTLAGRTELRGTLSLPRNGLIYGRVGADFFSGKPIPTPAIQTSGSHIPSPSPAAERRIADLFAERPDAGDRLPDSLLCSFLADSTHYFRLGNALIGNCTLRGRIVLHADELRLDSTLRAAHLIVCARKVTVGAGARISAQLFARDSLIVEPRVILEYPSGLYAQSYAEVDSGARVDGYVIVRDTARREKTTASYRQARTARVRGLVWIDGIAQVQGIVSGRLCVRRTAYFSPQGYYMDLLYDMTLLENPDTAQPLFLTDTVRRKEAVCVD